MVNWRALLNGFSRPSRFARVGPMTVMEGQYPTHVCRLPRRFLVDAKSCSISVVLIAIPYRFRAEKAMWFMPAKSMRTDQVRSTELAVSIDLTIIMAHRVEQEEANTRS